MDYIGLLLSDRAGLENHLGDGPVLIALQWGATGSPWSGVTLRSYTRSHFLGLKECREDLAK